MPVRKLTVNAGEKAALENALAFFETFKGGERVCKGLASLLEKVSKAAESRPAGLALPSVEAALSSGAGHKYAHWVSGNPSAALRQLSNAGATHDQLVRVGRWLARQDWIKGQMALPTIAKHWSDWLAKATGEELHTTETVERAPARFDE